MANALPGPAIEVDKLGLQLGRSQILHDISFSLAAGGIHCLIGPNGGGKTSTLRCLLGQMPHSGRIRLHWPDARRSIGYVPQLIEMEKTLPLTVLDFLVLGIQQRAAFLGSSRKQRPALEEVLQRTQLHDKADYMLASLSGGERQRVLFAQALLPQEPGLLVLDEPMTSLDEGGMQVFEKLIMELHAKGTTILWINHDLEQAERLADTLTVIDRTVLAHGPAAGVLSTDMRRGVFRSGTANSQAAAGAG